MNMKRVRLLAQSRSSVPSQGPVIYWMSRDQRAADNWALIHAQNEAIRRQVPLGVVFCRTKSFLQASSRSFSFMEAGLVETAEKLLHYQIPFFLLRGNPPDILPDWLSQQQVSLLVTDFDPLRIKQDWQQSVQQKSTCEIHQVDAHNIVPCWIASPKQEFGAYTFRPKLHRLLPEFMDSYPSLVKHPYSWPTSVPDPLASFSTLRSNAAVVSSPPAGSRFALQQLQTFIDHHLDFYEAHANHPDRDVRSRLSPYLHFGQLSAQHAASIVLMQPQSLSRDAFLEQLIVRRELADNYCYYQHAYASWDGLPAWSKETLNRHRNDSRNPVYSFHELEEGKTHDPLWNAAQQELRLLGNMHGYMRMYWAKKILEWSSDPETALASAIQLNDRYHFDGRDPNGYTGIVWSIGGVHDRPWTERPIFGKIRYMNARGAQRKFSIQNYIRQIEEKTGIPVFSPSLLLFDR